MHEDPGLRGIGQIQQWLLFLLQVCPAVRQARPSRPCDRPRRRRCVLHSQFRGEIRPVTPCVLPGNVQPGEWKEKICRGLVPIQKALWVCLGFSPVYILICFFFLCFHWTVKALNDAKRELRYLLVYLHGDDHQDTDEFCRYSNPNLLNYLMTSSEVSLRMCCMLRLLPYFTVHSETHTRKRPYCGCGPFIQLDL